MTGGGNEYNPNKIKGGRWTVVRFFLVSVAYSAPFMTVSSLLDYYATLYGPQVLLQMNVAYYLPSIPLLLVSFFLDEPLDRAFGASRVILVRLLFGLGGCALIMALWPFHPRTVRWLLAAVLALGLTSAIAFSASYQMVARFANKNVISLGLGCVGSGLVVLLLELGLGVGVAPSHPQRVALLELTTVLVVAGFVAAASLLVRHWRAIEAWAQPAANETLTATAPPEMLQQPLLLQTPHAEPQAILGPPRVAAAALPTPLARRASSFSLGSLARPMLSYSALDPFGVVSEAEGYGNANSQALRDYFRQQAASVTEAASPSPTLPAGSLPLGAALRPGDADLEGKPGGDAPTSFPRSPSCEPPSGVGGFATVLGCAWPVLLALFFSGTFFVLVFPFFTYVPSSGTFGAFLPKTLFFSRLGADVMGRTLPRARRFALASPPLLLALGLFMVATIPGYFAYCKAGPAWHSDLGVTVITVASYLGQSTLGRTTALCVAYVVVLWAMGGYINTCSYVAAPRCVPPHLRAAANGLLAIAYQTSHCTGLVLGLVVVHVVFGGLKPI